MVIQRRVLAPTVAVSCWFGRVAEAWLEVVARMLERL